MIETSPMTEKYFTEEDETLKCIICDKILAVAHRRFKNMRFENGTYKHLMTKEKLDKFDEVCKIIDGIYNKIYYLCQKHFEMTCDLKEIGNTYEEIINVLKKVSSQVFLNQENNI